MSTPFDSTSAALDHFALFGLPQRYAIDQRALEQSYRDVQTKVHPDRFAQASASEQRVSLQWATRANEAYQTLRDPLQRARHLLELRGVDCGLETNTAMPPDFLMQQMQWREALEAACDDRDLAALEQLAQELTQQTSTRLQHLAQHLDGVRDDPAAAGELRCLIFMQKFSLAIDDAREDIEEHA